MKIIVLVVLSLLVSCGPPVSKSKQDSVLNYKGATVVTKEIGINDCYRLRIRTYNKSTKQYVIKTIYVYDGYIYKVGEIIK